jgi:hypothetical protein
MAKPKISLRLPLRYPEPPPDQHQRLLTVTSIGWAFELKSLIYHHNPEVISVRIDATYPDGTESNWYAINYDIMVVVPESVGLAAVLRRAVQNYPATVQQRCFDLAAIATKTKK